MGETNTGQSFVKQYPHPRPRYQERKKKKLAQQSIPLRWVYTPDETPMRRICDVAFNIAIPSQRQRTSSMTITCENFRRKDYRKLSQQS